MRWIDLQRKSGVHSQRLRGAVVVKVLDRIAATLRGRVDDEEPRVVVVDKVRRPADLLQKVLRARLGFIAVADRIELIGPKVVTGVGANIHKVLDLLLIIGYRIETTVRIRRYERR